MVRRETIETTSPSSRLNYLESIIVPITRVWYSLFDCFVLGLLSSVNPVPAACSQPDAAIRAAGSLPKKSPVSGDFFTSLLGQVS